MIRPMRTAFSWIHLADLSDLDRRIGHDSAEFQEALFEDIRGVSVELGAPNAVFLTGDIGEKGRDYQVAREFLDRVGQVCSLSPGRIFVVPGNHDVDLESGGLLTRQLVQAWQAADVAAFDEVLRDAEAREVLLRRFKYFLDFADAHGPHFRFFWSKGIAGASLPIRIVGLNSVFLWSGEENGKLRIGRTQLSLLDVPSDEFVISLSHHPFDSTYLQDAHLARIEVDKHADLHLVSSSYLDWDVPAKSNGYGAIIVGAGGRPSARVNQHWVYHRGAIIEADDGRHFLRVWPRRWSTNKQQFDNGAEGIAEGRMRHVDFPLRDRRAGNEAPLTPKKWSKSLHTPYVERIQVDRIGAVHSVDWNLSGAPGWNVMIGDNGSGKSTFLRALAYSLIASSTYSSVTRKDEADKLPFDIRRYLRGDASCRVWQHADPANPAAEVPAFELEQEGDEIFLRHAERQDLRNMFHAGFGPFRRFTGGDESLERDSALFPRAYRHMSLFTERKALGQSIRWLKDLRLVEATNRKDEPLLQAIMRLINDERLLPHGVKLHEIGADGIVFTDGAGLRVDLNDLSDGFRSILSLTLEILRQLAAHYERDSLFDPETGVVVASGIVLIDEVDEHLHPTWQREIGVRLRSLFPQVQFIVTTHSALVCQGAADGCGSIFRLPQPGTDEEGRKLGGIELARILYGNVLDAYGTSAFGAPQRSEEGKILLNRLAELNLKESAGPLSDVEAKEQDELRAIFATSRS